MSNELCACIVSNDWTKILFILTDIISLTSVSDTINCHRDNCTKLQETNEWWFANHVVINWQRHDS